MTELTAQNNTKGAAFNSLLYGGHCNVPAEITVCPECGGLLHVESNEWVEETGIHTVGGLQVDCEHEESLSHRYWQSDWQSVIDTIDKWCGAEVI